MKMAAEIRSLFSNRYALGVIVAAIAFTYLQWQGLGQLRDFASEGYLPPCLKVSDFYSVHLTTFYLPTALDDDADPREKAMRYKQFCDHIPGPGRVIFTVDLMEDDTRDQSVQLSLSRYDQDGHLALVKLLPPNLHPHGVLTLETSIAEAGRYLLKVAFGDAKTQDDVIEMPISVAP